MFTPLLVWWSTYIYQTSTSKWKYNAVNNAASDWAKLYPECGYIHQSPINIAINENCVQPLVLDWTYHGQITHFGITNTGHSLQAIPFDIIPVQGEPADISGLKPLQHPEDSDIRLRNTFYNTYKSPINSEYCLDSLHFHWAPGNEYGSEHEINEIHYPLEAHLVHYSCDYFTSTDAFNAYSSGDAARKYDDNNVLSVIGILFQIGAANTALDKILSNEIINSVNKYHGTNVDLLYYTDFDMNDLLPQNREMFCYLGSLTTPPCYETVRWNVMKHTMTVSQEQMDKLRLMLQSTNLNDPMAPNWRPLQEVNNRKIYECQETVDTETVVKLPQVVSNNNNNNHAFIDNNMNSIDSTGGSGQTLGVQWYIIAYICIFLLIVAIIIIAYLSWIVCNKRKIYKQARDIPSVVNSENEDIQMIFPHSSNFSEIKA